MNTSIDQIASNRTAGAAEILRLASNVFSQLKTSQAEINQRNFAQAHRLIFDTALALVNTQPDMSPLLRLASAAISAARMATTAEEAFTAAEDNALTFIENADRATRTAASNAANLISTGTTVMTHSRSSTVLATLLEAKRRGSEFSVVATESRPGLEGRTLAEALEIENIRVRLIADSAASLAMTEVDLVLVGADTVTQKVLVNKIGTRMMGLSAREQEIPFYAVSDKSKFISGDYWRLQPRDLANSYFEPTPLSYFTGIITEDGVLSAKEASQCAERASIDNPLFNAIEESRGQIR